MSHVMNFILVSAHFPENYQYFAHRLKDVGINVLGIGDGSYESLPEASKQSLTEYYRVDSMDDYEQMYRAVAYFAFKYGKIDRIESHNEHWLETDARLRSDFNVFGFKASDMERVKRKSSMKKVFRSVDIPAARGRVFSDLADAKRLIEELAYPVVVKPDSGVGANDTWKLNDADDLARFYREKDEQQDYIMEEYIEGTIHSFDGLTDKDGKVVFTSSYVYNQGVLDAVTTNSSFFYYIDRVIPQALEDYGRKIVAAFELKERFFHIEFFERADGSYMALEINFRPPGGAGVEMFNYANDMDIFAEYANIVKHNRFEAKISRPYYCAYMSRKAGRTFAHNNEAIKAYCGEHLMKLIEVPKAFVPVLGSNGYVVRASDKETLLDALAYIDA